MYAITLGCMITVRILISVRHGRLKLGLSLRNKIMMALEVFFITAPPKSILFQLIMPRLLFVIIAAPNL